MEEKKIISKNQASTVKSAPAVKNYTVVKSTSSINTMATVKGLDYFIITVIAAIFFICPLFFTGLVAQNLGFEKMILFYFLVLLGTVAWITKGVILGELNFKRTPLDWPIVAVLAIFTVSTILSVSQKDSMIGLYGNSAKSLVAVIIYSLFYYLLVNNIDTKKIKLLFWSIIASSALISVYSLLQLFGKFLLPIDFTKNTGFNPLGSLSGLTMFLVITLPLFIVAISQLNEIHPAMKNKAMIYFIKITLSLFAIISLFILTLLNGFTFWPAAIVGIVITLMFFLSKITKITSSNLVIPIATFLLLIILLVLGNFNIMSLNLPVEVSLSRQASWQIAKANVIKNPIFGSGPSTFYYSFVKYKGMDFNGSPLWNVRFDSASGVFFELLASVGGLGSLAVMVLILITLSIIFISLIKVTSNESQNILLSVFASFISIILFAILFSMNSSLILVAVIISIFTLASAITLYPEKFKVMNLSFRASAKYALALAAIFLTVSAGVVILFTLGIKIYLADIYARQSYLTGDTNQKITKLNQAIQLAPYQDGYYLDIANNYMTLANTEASGKKDQTVIENALSMAIEQGKKAIDIAPNNVGNNEGLALIYENASFYVRGALEWAENLYNKVIVLEPDSPTPYIRLALINMARANAETDKTLQQQDINEAIKKYDQALAKKNDLGAAYYGKAIAYEKMDKLDDAIEQLKKAVILTRDNTDYQFELGRLFFNRGVSQQNLTQTASANITNGNDKTGDLSVKPVQTTNGTVTKNDDLNLAEQIFQNIVRINPNHANAIYSLAMIYQKTSDTNNAKVMVGKLLGILTDDATKEAVKKQFPGLY